MGRGRCGDRGENKADGACGDTIHTVAEKHNILREKAHSHGFGDRDGTGNLEACRAASWGSGDYDMLPG